MGEGGEKASCAQKKKGFSLHILLEQQSPLSQFFLSRSLPFNFSEVGATHTASTARQTQCLKHTWNTTSVRLGQGRNVFRRAASALFQWKHFDFDWAFTNKPVVKEGAGVVVTARSLFLWSLNPLRITSVEKRSVWSRRNRRRRRDGDDAKQTVSFTHTTLKGHQISGEERFSVVWKRSDDSVWYQISTVSSPATVISIVATPLLRWYQRKFVADSVKAMLEASNPPNSPAEM